MLAAEVIAALDGRELGAQLLTRVLHAFRDVQPPWSCGANVRLRVRYLSSLLALSGSSVALGPRSAFPRSGHSGRPFGFVKSAAHEESFHGVRLIPYPPDRQPKALLANTKFPGPIANFVVLLKADELAILAAVLRFVVSHYALPCRG